MKIPSYIDDIIGQIEKNGYEAYVVGGAVRDSLLNRPPSDYDIATNALPSEIEKIFKGFKIINIARDLGTILVIYKNKNIEITTYRLDGNYIDGRRPDNVVFSKDIGEDLKRRDFTINAMAYNKKLGLIDLFSGKEDLENKIIKTVGKPDVRFKEDHLRILRAVRFAAELNFGIGEETFLTCKKFANKLSYISMDRIREEVFKILVSENASYGIELLRETGILKVILPELWEVRGFNQNNPNHESDVYYHTLSVLDKVPNRLDLRLTALLHDLGKLHTYSEENARGHFYGHEEISGELAKNILKRLNTPKKLIARVVKLIENHMITYSSMKLKGKKRLIKRMGEKEVLLLIDFQIADRLGAKEEYRDVEDLLKVRKELLDIISNEEVYEEKQLAINGNDVIELGYNEGKEIGKILSFSLDLVMDNPELNNKEILLKLIEKKFIK